MGAIPGIEFATGARQAGQDPTPEVQAAVGRSGVEDGVCLLFCPHTTAGVTLNKKWDPSVRHPIGVWR